MHEHLNTSSPPRLGFHSKTWTSPSINTSSILSTLGVCFAKAVPSPHLHILHIPSGLQDHALPLYVAHNKALCSLCPISLLSCQHALQDLHFYKGSSFSFKILQVWVRFQNTQIIQLISPSTPFCSSISAMFSCSQMLLIFSFPDQITLFSTTPNSSPITLPEILFFWLQPRGGRIRTPQPEICQAAFLLGQVCFICAWGCPHKCNLNGSHTSGRQAFISMSSYRDPLRIGFLSGGFLQDGNYHVENGWCSGHDDLVL